MGESVKYIVAVLIVIFLVLIFMLSFILNKKTKKPVETKITPEGCNACKNYACTHKSEVEEEC